MANRHVAQITTTQFENIIKFFNGSVADLFSTSANYIVNDFVIYDGLLYQCINACSGAWVSDNWQVQRVFDNDGYWYFGDGDSGYCVIPSTQNIEYTGGTITPTFTGYDPAKMTVSGTTSAIEVGTYTTTFTLKDTVKHKWGDNTTEPKTVTWKIILAKVALPVVSDLLHTYDGTTKTAQFTYDQVRCTLTGNTSGINAGNYTFTISLNDIEYTQWVDDTTAPKSYTLVIEKATVALPTLEETQYEYTGGTITPTFIYDSSKISIGGDYSASNVGSYAASFTLTSANHCWPDRTETVKYINWEIIRALVTAPTETLVQVIYTGAEQTNGYIKPNTVSMTGNDRGTAIGTYVAVYSIIDKNNYQWDNLTDTDITVTLEILRTVPAKLDKFTPSTIDRNLKYFYVASYFDNKSLSITADNCSGRATYTTIHYTITATAHFIDESWQVILEQGDDIYGPFPQNTSTTETVTRTATYTKDGLTATAQFIQDVWRDQNYQLTLSGIGGYGFEKDTSILELDQTIYDGPYKSLNYNVDESQAVAKVDISGYNSFTIWINSYAESAYDYTIASEIDVDSYPTYAPEGNMNTRSYQRNPRNGLNTDNWRKITYTLDGSAHWLYITYRKDGSASSYDDRGYFVIERN